MFSFKHNLAILFIAISATLTSTAYAVPTTIVDHYIGSDAHSHGDVIGSTSNFQITSMDVSLSGNMLSVSILTSFAGKGDDHLFDSLTGNKGIGYGDLFLASSWTPYGSQPYGSDNTYTGTAWTYGFALDDRWMHENTAGSGTLYRLNSASYDNNTATNNNPDALLSEDFLTGGTFRNGQEVAVDTSEQNILNGNITAISGASSWNIDAASSRVNFLIDLTGTDLLLGDEIALHWAFTCANDVIEGAYPVSAPSILVLLGAGLVSLAGATGLRRKRILTDR